MSGRSIVDVRRAPAGSIGGLETLTPLFDPTDAWLDPFLMLAHHGPQIFPPNGHGPLFEDRPHRGFETVTFVIEDALVHSDSLGERREVSSGGVQWMTAGSGIVHNGQGSEVFRNQGGGLEILQLWGNLPKSLKAAPPRYVGVQADEVVTVSLEGGAGALHLVAGVFRGRTGPMRSLTGVFAAWLDVVAGSRVLLPAGGTHRAPLRRHGRDQDRGKDRRARRSGAPRQGGDDVSIETTADAVLLFAHADPIREPVAAREPFVMNTAAELDAAFRDYRAGQFGRPARSG